MKPAAGQSTPSASRNLLLHAARTVSTIYPPIRVLDLRETPLPFFDGRMPTQMPRDPLGECHDMVARDGALFIAIPAYWRAVSASFKNFVEVLSGPGYNAPCPNTPFSGKPIGYFVVGADGESATAADRQARAILECLGAHIVVAPVVMGNPAEMSNQLASVAQQIIAGLGSLAQQVAESARSAQ